MNKVYISRNYRHPFTASSKAKTDGEEIAAGLGFRNIGLPRRSFGFWPLAKAWDAMSHALGKLRMPSGGTVFLQYPSDGIESLVETARKKGNRTIVLLHDINSIRFNEPANELDFLHDADHVIVHSERMARLVGERYPDTDVQVLGMFDYLHAAKSTYRHDGIYRIIFAGNLGKSSFLSRLKDTGLYVNLYGVGVGKHTLTDSIIYKGCFPPDELGSHLEGDFGLVWDGDSLESCEGVLGNYLKIIAPHKMSMYLSSGIPVIVWDGSAMRDIVVENNIGIAVTSLAMLPDMFGSLSLDKYAAMKENAVRFAARLGCGAFLTDALRRCMATDTDNSES